MSPSHLLLGLIPLKHKPENTSVCNLTKTDTARCSKDSFAVATDATARVRQKALPQLYKELD